MTKTYTAAQVSAMIIDPYFEGDALQLFPQLQELNDWPDDKLIKFLSWCYDPYSPLVREYPDIRKRKEQAKAITGHAFSARDTKATSEFIKKVVSNRTWTLIVSLDFTFDEYTDKVNTLIVMDEPDKMLKAVELKNKMLQQMGEMLRIREDMYSKMFHSDSDLMSSEGYRDLSPEDMSKRNRK